MKLQVTGTNCSTTMRRTIEASNVGDTGPEKREQNRKVYNYLLLILLKTFILFKCDKHQLYRRKWLETCLITNSCT